MNTPVIEVDDLAKSYGSHRALTGVSFTVDRGQIFAMLGPNGAGKTTTISILTTLQKPDSGTARICGADVVTQPKEVRRSISVTGQFASVDAFQSGRENLAMMCRLAGLAGRQNATRTDELLARFDLESVASRRVSTYSGGLRRRLDVAISLISRPPVVFLDEPTTGLDPRSRAQLWAAVRELAAEGITILLTTQYLDEADQLADQIVVLGEGAVVAHGSPDELKRRVGGRQRVLITFENAESFERARQLLTGTAGGRGAGSIGAAGMGAGATSAGGSTSNADGELPAADPTFNSELLQAGLATSSPVSTVRWMLDRAAERQLELSDISIVKPTLDEVFFSLTGASGGASGAATDGAPDDASEGADARREQTEGVAA